MDRTAELRAIVKRVLEDYARFFEHAMPEDIQLQTVFDEAHDHYFIYHTGWHNDHRIHGTPLHIDIINGKIWIQHDGTKDGIADELMEAGIAKNEIVLAFYPKEHRQYTEFAIA